VRVDAEAVGHLGNGEQAPSPEPSEAVLDPVSATKQPEVALGEPVCHTRTKSHLVEDGGDLGLRVVVEETVDFRNGRGIGIVELGGAERGRQVEAAGGAAAKANRGQ
jgi:hypothetical protein